MTRSVQIEAIGLANPPRRFGQHGAFQMAGYTGPRIGCAGALPTLTALAILSAPILDWGQFLVEVRKTFGGNQST